MADEGGRSYWLLVNRYWGEETVIRYWLFVIPALTGCYLLMVIGY